MWQVGKMTRKDVTSNNDTLSYALYRGKYAANRHTKHSLHKAEFLIKLSDIASGYMSEVLCILPKKKKKHCIIDMEGATEWMKHICFGFKLSYVTKTQVSEIIIRDDLGGRVG
jgi:hypothetical protein